MLLFSIIILNNYMENIGKEEPGEYWNLEKLCNRYLLSIYFVLGVLLRDGESKQSQSKLRNHIFQTKIYTVVMYWIQTKRRLGHVTCYRIQLNESFTPKVCSTCSLAINSCLDDIGLNKHIQLPLLQNVWKFWLPVMLTMNTWKTYTCFLKLSFLRNYFTTMVFQGTEVRKVQPIKFFYQNCLIWYPVVLSSHSSSARFLRIITVYAKFMFSNARLSFYVPD